MRNIQLFILLLVPLCLPAQDQPAYVVGTEVGIDFRKFQPDLYAAYISHHTLSCPGGQLPTGR